MTRESIALPLPAPPEADLVSATAARRAERLTTRPSYGEHNALWYWYKAVPRRRVVYNYILMRLARVLPSLSLKNWLYRRMGMKVGRHVSVGLEVTVDIFFPELITIEDEAIIGFGATLLCHEFLQREYRTGPIVIGKGAIIGTQSLVMPGVRVAPGAVVSAMSLVNRDVEGFVGGVPARPLRRGSSERNV
jgi:acetyltransferase-like isoleucine patch superfamily enzyme